MNNPLRLLQNIARALLVTMIVGISVWTAQVPNSVAANYINTEDSGKGGVYARAGGAGQVAS